MFGKFIKSNASGLEKFKAIREKLLGIESVYGGKSEGVVLDFGNKVYKLLQDDQHDKALRKQIKDEWKDENDDKYWEDVRSTAEGLVEKIKSGSLKDRISKLSKSIYTKDFGIGHSKKKAINIQDDIFLTAKNILIKKMPGNNGALFVGRFSPLTIAHARIIKAALKKYDTVTVNIVKGKKDERNPFTVELQEKMFRAVFGDTIELMSSSSGMIPTIINKSKNNINVVLAGSDRADGYAEQLSKYKDVEVVEIPRKDKVSGTAVREALAKGDKEAFKALTPKEIWGMFDELKGLV